MKKKPENQVGFVCFGEINTPIERLYLKHDEAFKALSEKVANVTDCGLVIDDPERFWAELWASVGWSHTRGCRSGKSPRDRPRGEPSGRDRKG